MNICACMYPECLTAGRCLAYLPNFQVTAVSTPLHLPIFYELVDINQTEQGGSIEEVGIQTGAI